VAVSAPTGQIWTVLPLKYDENGCRGTWPPRPAHRAGEVDLGLAGDVLGEARTAAALDAALTVEQDELGDGDGLFEVALLLDEAALTRPVGERLS